MKNNDLGWWLIHGDNFLAALHAVAEGEDPDMIYAELYANAEIDDQRENDASEK